MSRKKLTIGLFGFGCVGHGLYEVLERTPGLQASIKRICVKDKHKTRPLPADRFTFDKQELLDDNEINVVVELIDDPTAAFDIVSSALKKGKAVVSANKKMIAENFQELLELQKTYNTPFLYEAACCASIPVIRNLEEYYDTNLLESVEGIVNGSTNYILTKTSEEGLPYQLALKEAQQKGYAETNPTLDTAGFDAKYKLLLLIAHAFGLVLKPDKIFNLGIESLGELELNYAREKGYKIKLVAQAGRNSNGNIVSWVFPKFVDKNDKLFSVDDVFNGIKIRSVFSDTQFFSGKGAGAYPTASAVISDISALAYDYRYEYKKLGSKDAVEKEENIFLKVLLRHSDKDAVSLKKRFVTIEEFFLNQESGYIVGVISLEQLKRVLAKKERAYSFVLFQQVESDEEFIQEPEIELRELYS